MTNAEKWKTKILMLCEERDFEGFVGFAVQNGEPCFCEDVDGCNVNCDICGTEETNCTCDFIRWLYKEYEEPKPKLKPAEIGFCGTIAQEAWIARDCDGRLYIHAIKPTNANGFWNNNGESYVEIRMNMFQFIGKDKPWSIEDLLKLEVK